MLEVSRANIFQRFFGSDGNKAILSLAVRPSESFRSERCWKGGERSAFNGFVQVLALRLIIHASTREPFVGLINFSSTCNNIFSRCVPHEGDIKTWKLRSTFQGPFQRERKLTGELSPYVPSTGSCLCARLFMCSCQSYANRKERSELLRPTSWFIGRQLEILRVLFALLCAATIRE